MKHGITLRSSAALAVDFFPVPNPYDQDNQPVILNLADDPEIAQPVSPKFAETGTLQCFSNAAGIFQFCNSVSEKFQDSTGMLWIELG
jgi:hypothetical protein